MGRTAYLLALVAVAPASAAACGSSEPDVSSGSTSSTTSAASGPGTTPGSGPASGGGSTAVTPATLAGTTFVSTSVTGHELVAGSQIRLSFTDTSLSANA